jgi:hypothetical protein
MQLRTSSLAMLLLTACSGGSEGPDAGPPDANPFCLEAEGHSDLAWIQEHIFTPSCADFRACHQGRALEAGELSLEAEDAHEQLVGVESNLFSEYQRVVPGEPENSYLMVILGHIDGPIDEKVGTMPYNSPLLCTEMREAIERWIEDGAPSGDPPDAGLPDAMP